MDGTGPVRDFVRHAKEIMQVLRHEDYELSDIDLHMLAAQLHLLEIEVSNLQTFRKLQMTDRAA